MMPPPILSIADRRRRRRQDENLDASDVASEPRLKTLAGPITPLVIDIPINETHLLMEAVTCSYWSPESPTFDQSADQGADMEFVRESPQKQDWPAASSFGGIKDKVDRETPFGKTLRPSAPKEAKHTRRRWRPSLPRTPADGQRATLAGCEPVEPAARQTHGRSWSVTQIKPEELHSAAQKYCEITGSDQARCNDVSVEIMPAKQLPFRMKPVRPRRVVDLASCLDDTDGSDGSCTRSSEDVRHLSDETGSQGSCDGYSQTSTLLSDEGGDSDDKASSTALLRRVEDNQSAIHRIRRKPAPVVPADLDEAARAIGSGDGQHPSSSQSSMQSSTVLSRSPSSSSNESLKKQRRYGTVFAYEPRDASLAKLNVMQPSPSPNVTAGHSLHVQPHTQAMTSRVFFAATATTTTSSAQQQQMTMPPPLHPPPSAIHHQRQRSAAESRGVKFVQGTIPHDHDAMRSSYFHHNGLRRSQSTENFARRAWKRYAS